MSKQPSRLPLSAAQLGIWLGQALDPETTAYWAAEYIELEGPLDSRALTAAVARTVAETQSLQLRFDMSAYGPHQELHATTPFELRHVDVSTAQDPAAAALDAMQTELSSAVDLRRGPLVASTLFRLGPERHFWLLRAHHIALDGYAFSLVQRRVAALYAEELQGAKAPPACAASIADWVAEDQNYRRSASFTRDREFWLTRLQTAAQAGALLPPQPLSRHTRYHRGVLPAHLLPTITAQASELRVELPAWLNAAVAAWLASELDVEACTFGLPITSRLASVAAQLPCMAMNILPLALRWGPTTTFAELARAVVAEQRAARPHQRYRYEDLKKDLAWPSGRRLFGLVVNWMPFDSCDFSGARSTKHPLAAGPVEDLAVAFTPSPQGLRVDLEANPCAYDDATLGRCHAALLSTIEAAASSPHGRLTALPRQNSVRPVLALRDGTPLAAPAQPLLARLIAAATAKPDSPAIEQEGQAPLSYGQLLTAVQRLAGRLSAAGVEAGARVALLLPRAPDSIVAQLAVLWVGAAYVPLEPSGPAARTLFVLDDAQPSLLVTLQELASIHSTLALPCLVLDEAEAAPAAPIQRPREVEPAAIAYVIYTSGSTGKPNGVLVSRGALDHFVAAAGETYEFFSQDRVLQFAPLAFDASVEEIMVTLGNGATLVLRTDAMLESLPCFLQACARQAISVLDLPTAYFHELALALRDQTKLPDCLRLLIIGGEAALPEPVARFREHASANTVLLNTYGPTETTVVCTTAVLAGPSSPELLSGALPIGQPLPGVSVLVVDAELGPVAREAEGQLCVLGPTLGSGYLGQPETSARRFVALHKLRGAPPAYLTGDRVRMTQAGELIYLGRLDEELKISGYRVNPLEVETALLALDSVVEAAVVTCATATGKQLSAFVVSRSSDPSPSTLRQELARHLAAPAIPSQLNFVERLPRDANGKIDRSQLRALTPEPATACALSEGPLEHLVARVWREVLEREVPNVDFDFFELGGHSLLALRVADRLSRTLQRDVPLSALFRHPTVRSLAESLKDLSGDSSYAGQSPLAPLVALQAGTGLPLFCLPPADGLAWCYLGLTRFLPGVSLLALQAPGLTGAAPPSFEALLDHYLELILAAEPRGPYRLLGWSLGGGVAHAIACRLQARGAEVSLVAMLDAYPAEMWQGKPEPTAQDAWIAMLDEADAAALQHATAPLTETELLARVKRPGSSLASFDDATLSRMCEVALDSMRSYRTAQHARLNAGVLFFRASRRALGAPAPGMWQPHLSGALNVIDVDATHLQMCSPAALATISAALAPRL